MATKVLIAGMAGASLGTEILKCLVDVSEYEIYGCDIAPLAYGLYSDKLAESFVVDRNNYIDSIVLLCVQKGIKYIIPGGEQPMVLLGNNAEVLKRNDIVLVSNSPDVIDLFSNKEKTFRFLGERGIKTPFTKRILKTADIGDLPFPLIVKPSSGTGGSDSVFLASNLEECKLYVELLLSNKREVIIQEYIDLDEGEFTIGVLSDSEGEILGSVAMKRVFDSKLSVAYKGSKGLISSGYSQGLIDDFANIRKQAEQIAKVSGSKGPFNIQGRLRNGILIPFEINPRFSASTYLRKLAGFNEVHLYLNHLINGKRNSDWKLNPGYYLRSFDETYIPLDQVKK